MTLLNSVEKGIDSSTYNPEAEKARAEEKKAAIEAKQKYRDTLFQIRDKKAKMVQDKKASDFYIKQADELVNQGFSWLTANPDAESSVLNDKMTTTLDTYQDIAKANVTLLGLLVLPQFYKTNAADLFLKKQISQQKKTEIDAFAESIEGWLKTSKDLSVEAIFSKQQEFTAKAKEVLEGTGISTPAFTNETAAQTVEQEVSQKETQVKKEEEADKNTFKLGRLVSETGKIAMKVVGSLFIVMLILVSGMLTANDAIARDPQYRILYFIYGGIGFPFMLFYYLYRWYAGTAPYIYRLLPIFNTPSDTTLGRFLLFPFTYKEDDAAKEAKTKFMTQAANLVGKEYKPPAEALRNALGSIVDGIEGLALNSAEAAKKGVKNILEGIEEISITK
jgi:acylphosphatase